MLKAYIISYFGVDPAIQERRRLIHKRQVEFFQSKLNIPIIVLPMEYRRNDYLPGVEYLGNSSRLNQSLARNILLEKFYKTSDRYGLFLDNDTSFYEYKDWDKLKQLEEIDCDDLHLFQPLDPLITPYKKIWSETSEDLENYFIFKKTSSLRGSMIFVRNGLDLFFDEDFLAKEDDDFALQAIRRGLGVYSLFNMAFKEYESRDERSTSIELLKIKKNLNSRTEMSSYGDSQLIEKYGNIDKKLFTSNRPKKLIINKRSLVDETPRSERLF